MKTWKLAGVALVATLVAAGIYGKRTTRGISQTTSGVSTPSTEEAILFQPLEQSVPDMKSALSNTVQPRTTAISAPAAQPPPEPSWTVEQAVDILVSPRTAYPQRQAIWKQLKEPDQLDKAIADLEARVKNDPQVADYSAVLGTAYLKKAGLTKDMRDQAMLAMKADQTFDTALASDPTSWEARYMKAVGMSYWPAQMIKGYEVFERFTSLIQDQEQQSPQPEFSQTYVRLGDEYRKAGQVDNARQVWERGAAQFPDETEFKRKLASIQ